MTAALVVCALLVGILAGWFVARFRYAKANKVYADLAHLEYLRERYEAKHTVDIGGTTVTVDDPEHYIAKGAPRAEVVARRPRRG